MNFAGTSKLPQLNIYTSYTTAHMTTEDIDFLLFQELLDEHFKIRGRKDYREKNKLSSERSIEASTKLTSINEIYFCLTSHQSGQEWHLAKNLKNQNLFVFSYWHRSMMLSKSPEQCGLCHISQHVDRNDLGDYSRMARSFLHEQWRIPLPPKARRICTMSMTTFLLHPPVS